MSVRKQPKTSAHAPSTATEFPGHHHHPMALTGAHYAGYHHLPHTASEYGHPIYIPTNARYFDSPGAPLAFHSPYRGTQAEMMPRMMTTTMPTGDGFEDYFSDGGDRRAMMMGQRLYCDPRTGAYFPMGLSRTGNPFSFNNNEWGDVFKSSAKNAALASGVAFGVSGVGLGASRFFAGGRSTIAGPEW
jgi:hypothetical protein